MLFELLGAAAAGWCAGESIRRGRRVADSRLGSGERLGQGTTVDEELIEAQSAYEKIARDPTATAREISEHYSLYRELYLEYQRQLALGQQLERMAWELDQDALDATISAIPETRAAAERRMKARLARMEELWPGWYKSHLEWEVYRRTGGKPDWYIELESMGLSAINLAIQLVPFFQGMRGGVRAPGVRVPTPSIRQPGIVIPPKGPEPIYPFRPGDPLRRPFVVPTPSAAPAPALLKPAPPPIGTGEKPPPGFVRADERWFGKGKFINPKTFEIWTPEGASRVYAYPKIYAPGLMPPGWLPGRVPPPITEGPPPKIVPGPMPWQQWVEDLPRYKFGPAPQSRVAPAGIVPPYLRQGGLPAIPGGMATGGGGAIPFTGV